VKIPGNLASLKSSVIVDTPKDTSFNSTNAQNYTQHAKYIPAELNAEKNGVEKGNICAPRSLARS
jgi:hypothetical protein